MSRRAQPSRKRSRGGPCERLRAQASFGPCVKPGKQALAKEHRGRLDEAKHRVECSVDLDAAFEKDEPSAHRWDYVLVANGGVRAVEPHPANAGEVDRLVHKKRWAQTKLAATMPSRWVWIASGAVEMSPTCSEARRLAAAGVEFPVTHWRVE